MIKKKDLGVALLACGSVLFGIFSVSWVVFGAVYGVLSLTPETAAIPLLGMITGLGMTAIGYMWFKVGES